MGLSIKNVNENTNGFFERLDERKKPIHIDYQLQKDDEEGRQKIIYSHWFQSSLMGFFMSLCEQFLFYYNGRNYKITATIKFSEQ